MEISKKLDTILNRIEHPIAQELLTYDGRDISTIDVTGANNMVSYTKGKHNNRSKIGSLVRSMFGKKYSDKDVWQFVELFKIEYDNSNSLDIESEGEDFKWVANTFKRLTSETYPHGTEDAVVPLLELKGLKKDICGNYYKIIGDDATTMFTCHLDTASFQKVKVGYILGRDKTGNVFAYTNGKSILGADDKAGTTIMLYMMKNNIPGIYYFFIGEERGMIGSGELSDRFHEADYLKNVTKCISFDRRNYHSVITHQMGRQCCSIKFAESLIAELNKNGMSVSQDPGGVFTDSASFVGIIPECTNISVGYFGEHTSAERQNLTHLTLLSKACVGVNWKGLAAQQKPTSSEIMQKYKNLINYIKYNNLKNEVTFEEEESTLMIYFEVSSTNLEDLHRDIQILHILLSRSGHDYKTTIVSDIIKIKLLS